MSKLKELKMDRSPELTRRIKSSEEHKINAKLASLLDVDKKIDELIQALVSKSPWEFDETCINHEDMPYIALLAVQNKLIEVQQFATLMLYWSVVQDTGSAASIQSCRLFEEPGTELFQNLHSDYYDEEPVLDLVPKEYKEFLEKMKSLPVSEQQFFLIEDDKRHSILKVLELNNFTVFGQINRHLMIASMGMMQTYLNVKFKSQAVDLNPVLGLSSVEDIRKNSLKNTRDIAFHFPNVSIPDKADNHSALWHRFTRHDFYHGVIVSCAPAAERSLLILTSDAVKNYLAENSIPVLNKLKSIYPKNVAKIIYQYWRSAEEPSIKFIINALIDMEVTAYRPDKQFADAEADLETMYWGTLVALFAPSVIKALSLTPLSMETLEEIFIPIFKLAKEHGRTREPQSGFEEVISIYQENPHSSVVYDLDQFPPLWNRVNICNILAERLRTIPAKTPKSDLKQIIQKEMVPFFSLVNVLKVLQYATNVKMGVLQQACMIFIFKNFLPLVERSNFKEFQQNRPKIMNSLIKNLYTSHFFKDVFKAAMNESKSNSALELLFSYPQFLNLLDKKGFCAINYAIEWVRKDIVSTLLALGADVNPQKVSKALPTLFGAMHVSNPEIFETIYKAGFNLEVKHQGKNYIDYYLSLLEDPETYMGIIKKTRQGNHHFNYKEAILYRDAIVENRTFSETENDSELEKLQRVLEADSLPNQTKSQIEARRKQYVFEKIKSSLLWECKRLDPSHLSADINPERSAMKIIDVSLINRSSP